MDIPGRGDVVLRLEPQFDEPIALADGRRLVTLDDAATALPDEESSAAEWQAAIEVLMLCSRGGQTDTPLQQMPPLPSLLDSRPKNNA